MIQRVALSRVAAAVALLSFAGACGPASQAEHPIVGGPSPSASAVASGQPAGPPADPWAIDGLVREEWLPLLAGPQPVFAAVTLPATPKNVPAPPPASCSAYVKRATAPKPACADKTASLKLLDEAMAVTDPAARDAKLAPLEGCASFEPGVIRSLRVELGPPECGDALAEPLLTKASDPKAPIPGAIHHTLVGQALAARLLRTVLDPPKLDPPYTLDRVKTFTKGPLFTWFTDQAKAVEELSKMGAELSYYGKGIAAIAAGTADMRLVEAVREAPIPDEFKSDPQAANEYYSNLDIALDPRKNRGRDAALVGLKEMAHAGIVEDARTRTARQLLAKLFGGRRVDSLDALLVPAAPAPKGATVNERLAATLPIFFVGVILDGDAAKDPGVLSALATRGVPVPFRVALKDATLDDAGRSSYAHARLLMGLRYWRAVDVDAAAVLYSKSDRAKLTLDDRLSFALALALRNGPDDVAVLMQKEGIMPPDFGRVGALDTVASDDKAGVAQGNAAFDAAIIAQLALPRGSDAAAWDALAKRYAASAVLLTDDKARIEAQQREKAAQATAKTLARKD